LQLIVTITKMNNFVVSARKYRPSTFDTVVGQGSITATLKNAIRNKHLAQAFLFCGPRGVGKTTCARILAKTINCSNITENIEACDKCESCVSFNESHSLNIYELDAASNNSVDDIRNLVEQVRYAPHSGQYKIYIIDEVHMLSAGAFNAFLKTLEEPPPYAIFILATTEKHKIIPTILSRCQIFDFNRIQIDDIASHLENIAAKEGVQAEADALHMIAQKADGALRDALSIFDQIVSFAGNTITYKDVIANLNILDYDYYFRITHDIHAGNYGPVLLTFNELLNDGFDGHNFINGLSKHFRDLLVCGDDVTLELLEVSRNIREKYRKQAAICEPVFLIRLLEIANKCDVEYKAAKNQRLHVELTLIKMCSLNASLTGAGQQTISDTVTVTPAAAAGSQKKSTETAATDRIIPSTVIPVKPISQATAPSSAGQAIAAEPPAVPIKKPATPSALKTISISGNNSKPAEEQPVDPNEGLGFTRSVPFTDTELQKAWNELAENIKSKGRSTLYVALTKHQPVLKENHVIELVIDNKIQEDEIRSEKQTMLFFLKKQLTNKEIQLETIVKTPDEKTETAYTNKEKFKKMSEKNPDLNHLKNLFDLEIDY
jgi:DNA polymerase-3 subunit gamma/tau